MAKGDWWFKFEWNDWLSDEHLLRCSFEAQGFWIRCVCLMYRSDSFELAGSVDDIRRLLGCLPEEVTRCAQELKRTEAADVSFGNGTVSIVSRRRKKELEAKERNRLQVAEHRRKSDVSGESADRVRVRVKSNKKEKEIREEKKEEAKPPAPAVSKKIEATRIPDPFPMTDEMRTWAAETYPTLRLDRAHENFIEHYTNDTTKKGYRVDWFKTWKKGMGLAMDWQNEGAAKSRPTTAPSNRVTARQMHAANVAVMERDKAEADALLALGH